MQKQDIIFKVVTSKNLKVRLKNKNKYFMFKNFKVVMPDILGSKFLQLNKSRQYSLLRQMIDIYKDEIVTNF